jgi:hypothetical protein
MAAVELDDGSNDGHTKPEPQCTGVTDAVGLVEAVGSSKRTCGLNRWEHRSSPRASRSSLRLQPGHHHSYHFVSMFMPHHVAWRAERLWRGQT